MTSIRMLGVAVALALLASCGNNATTTDTSASVTPPAGPAEIFRREQANLVVSLDRAAVYVEADCGDPSMDRYLFLHFVTADGRSINSDFGFDDNAPQVSAGPPARCRATVNMPAGETVARVEVGQSQSAGGSYIWNVTHDVPAA